MDNQHSPSRRTRGASGTDHLIFGIGAAPGLNIALGHECWFKGPDATGEIRHSGRMYSSQGNRQLPLADISSTTQDSQSCQAATRVGSRTNSAAESVRQATCATPAMVLEHARSPLSPIETEDGAFDRTLSTHGPETLQSRTESTQITGPTIQLFVGLLTPPGSDCNNTELECAQSQPSDTGSSQSSRSSHPVVHTYVGPKRHDDVSQQASAHVGLGSRSSSACSCCDRGGHDTSLMELEPQSMLGVHFDPINASKYGAPLKSLPGQRIVGQARALSSVSNESLTNSATGRGGAYLDPFNAQSHVPRVPSPLRANVTICPKSLNQPLPTITPSNSAASFSSSSKDFTPTRPSGQSQMFLCRFEGCFEQNQFFFMEEESRNHHESSMHGFVYGRVAQKTLVSRSSDMEASKNLFNKPEGQASIVHERQPDRASELTSVVEPSHESHADEANPPVMCFVSSSQETARNGPANEIANRSTASSKPVRDNGVAGDIKHCSPKGKGGATESPESSENGGRLTSSNSSSPSSDGEMLQPWPKAKMEEMIDEVMKQFEGMFDHFLDFDTLDGLDMSDSDDSDDEEEKAPITLITSPASQHSGKSPSTPSSILDTKARCHVAKGESSKTGGTPRPASSRAGSSKNPSASSKRKFQDSEQPDDGEGDGNSERRKRTKDSAQDNKAQRFACPYYQRSRSTSQGREMINTSCVLPGFKTVARMKEHLYRCHMQPPHCVRCCEQFGNQKELDEHHLATERCQELLEKRVIEGMTSQQERDIRSRKAKEGVNSEEDKWNDVYSILFPTDSDIPSPYCIYTQDVVQLSGSSPGSVNFQAFESYSRRELPRIVREEVRNAASREQVLMQERLVGVMVDAARRAIETLWAGFCEDPQRLGGATPSNGAISASFAEPRQNRAASAGQMEFHSPPSLQSAVLTDERTFAEAQAHTNQAVGTPTEASQSDSTYGTLVSGSDATFRQFQPLQSNNTMSGQPSYIHASLHQTHSVAGTTLPDCSNQLDPCILATQYPSANPQQQPDWTYMGNGGIENGYSMMDWSAYGQTVPTGVYPGHTPFSGPHAGMDGNTDEVDN